MCYLCVLACQWPVAVSGCGGWRTVGHEQGISELVMSPIPQSPVRKFTGAGKLHNSCLLHGHCIGQHGTATGSVHDILR